MDPAFLSERLGPFVIIVLGESVVQIGSSAADAPYGLGLLATAIASFVLLAGMFGLSVVFGHAGLPHLRAGRIPTRAALGPHALVTAVVATVAVSLSSVIDHGSDPLSDKGRWLLCGAVATYFSLGVVTGVVSRSSDLERTISRVTTASRSSAATGRARHRCRGPDTGDLPGHPGPGPSWVRKSMTTRPGPQSTSGRKARHLVAQPGVGNRPSPGSFRSHSGCTQRIGRIMSSQRRSDRAVTSGSSESDSPELGHHSMHRAANHVAEIDDPYT